MNEESKRLNEIVEELREMRRRRFPHSVKPPEDTPEREIWDLYVLIPDRLDVLQSRVREDEQKRKP